MHKRESYNRQMNQILSSTASTRTSLEAIRHGEAGLNEKRKSILARVPCSGDWATFERDMISIRDIAYLSAATQHEFALLRGKARDIILHGVERHCNFDEELLDLLQTKKLRLIAHTHSDYGAIEPSVDDREFLKHINQKSSIIVSYITGVELEFSANLFDDF